MQVQIIVLNLKSKNINMNANELIRGHCKATGNSDSALVEMQGWGSNLKLCEEV